jgi:hypothetical protein
MLAEGKVDLSFYSSCVKDGGVAKGKGKMKENEQNEKNRGGEVIFGKVIEW